MVYCIYHFSIKNRLIGEIWMLTISIFLRYYYVYKYLHQNMWICDHEGTHKRISTQTLAFDQFYKLFLETWK